VIEKPCLSATDDANGGFIFLFDEDSNSATEKHFPE